jgi:hypothetical protein
MTMHHPYQVGEEVEAIDKASTILEISIGFGHELHLKSLYS